MKSWDTNFLLRHLLEDDAAQLTVVRRHLDAVERSDTRIFLPQLVVVEAAWYLRGRMSPKSVAEVLAEVLQDPRFA